MVDVGRRVVDQVEIYKETFAIIDLVGGGDTSLTEMDEHISRMNVFDWNLRKYTIAKYN